MDDVMFEIIFDPFTEIKLLVYDLFSRKSSAIFGYNRKSSVIFGNFHIRKRSCGLRTTFGEYSEIYKKWLETVEKSSETSL